MSNVTSESYKIYFSFKNGSDLLYLIVLIILILGVIAIFKDGQEQKTLGAKGSKITLISLLCCIGALGFCLFTPSTVIKKTQISKENIPVVQVEGKLLSQNGLTLYLKNSEGKYLKKSITVGDDKLNKLINFGDDIEIKEAGSSYKYETFKTKVTYQVRSIIPDIRVPNKRNRTIVKTIVTIPQKSLTVTQ